MHVIHDTEMCADACDRTARTGIGCAAAFEAHIGCRECCRLGNLAQLVVERSADYGNAHVGNSGNGTFHAAPPTHRIDGSQQERIREIWHAWHRIKGSGRCCEDMLEHRTERNPLWQNRLLSCTAAQKLLHATTCEDSTARTLLRRTQFAAHKRPQRKSA